MGGGSPGSRLGQQDFEAALREGPVAALFSLWFGPLLPFLGPLGKSHQTSFASLFFNVFIVCFCLFRASPMAYGSSQASGQIGAAAAPPTPQPQPRSFTQCARPRINATMPRIRVGFLSTEPRQERLLIILESIIVGEWLRSSVSENETHEHGEISTGLFPCAEGRGCSKSASEEEKSLPIYP